MTFLANTVAVTVRGTPVEIIAVLSPEQQDSHGDCIIGIIVSRDGTREICSWQRDGRFRADRPSTDMDLKLPTVRALTAAQYASMVETERRQFAASIREPA